ncbi:MAG: monovalent cation/H+ antiporter complex subunit F [Janthinobacterium lividum]
MFRFYLIAIAFFLTLITYGLVRQRNFFSKIILLNSLTSLASLFIFTLGCFQGNKSYFDIALIYLMLGFISNGAYLRYLQQQRQ